MGVRRLYFLLLLPVFVFCGVEETIVKIIEREADVTQICSGETLNNITLTVCKIGSERHRTGECSLMYRDGQEVLNKCDSRFKLMKENQTVFLHLTNLTQEDSGSYTCECEHNRGTYVLQLNVTLKGKEELTGSTEILTLIPSGLLGAVGAVIITGLILACTYWMRTQHSGYSVPVTPGLSVHESPGSLDEDDKENPYASLQQPTNDLYQTITPVHHQQNFRKNLTRTTENFCCDDQDDDPDYCVYENI